MEIMAIRLQKADINFIEVKARHRGDKVVISEFLAASDDDLLKFKGWAGVNGIVVENARVATPAEIKANDEVAW